MSSFIGHGLAALTIGESLPRQTDYKSFLFWQMCLTAAALAPDIDYVLHGLNAPHNGGVRLTHSIAFSLIVPFAGIIYLALAHRKNIVRGGFQIVLAGVSHLFLDTLVGGRQGDPLFYPFSQDAFRLPFGILPSAGKLSFSNFYFYRNLLIECGILIPVCCLILGFAGKIKLNKLSIAGLVSVLLIFLVWSINLSR
jgi:inner membrane protein